MRDKRPPLPWCSIYKRWGDNDQSLWAQGKLDRGENIRSGYIRLSHPLIIRNKGGVPTGCEIISRFPPNIESWFIFDWDGDVPESVLDDLSTNRWIED